MIKENFQNARIFNLEIVTDGQAQKLKFMKQYIYSSIGSGLLAVLDFKPDFVLKKIARNAFKFDSDFSGERESDCHVDRLPNSNES